MSIVKNMAALGAAVALVAGGLNLVASHGGNGAFYDGVNSAFEHQNQMEYSFYNPDAEMPKDARYYIYDCDEEVMHKDENASLDVLINRDADISACKIRRQKELSGVANWYMKNFPDKEKLFEHLNNNLKKALNKEVGNTYNVSAYYMVWQAKQIAEFIDGNADKIVNPLSVGQKLQGRAYELTNNNALAEIGVTLFCFIMFVPAAWIGVWRLIGAAFRSAKKSVRG